MPNHFYYTSSSITGWVWALFSFRRCLLDLVFLAFSNGSSRPAWAPQVVAPGSEASTAAVGGAKEVLTPVTPACLRWASESRSVLAASGSNGLQLAVSSS